MHTGNIEIYSNYDYDDINGESLYFRVEGQVDNDEEIRHKNILIKNITKPLDEASVVRRYVEEIVNHNPHVYFQYISYCNEDHELFINYKGKDLDLSCIDKLNNEITFLSNENIINAFINAFNNKEENDQIDQISAYQVARLIDQKKKEKSIDKNNCINRFNKLIERTNKTIVDIIQGFTTTTFVLNDGSKLDFDRYASDWKFDSKQQFTSSPLILGLIYNDLTIYYENYLDKFSDIRNDKTCIRATNNPFNVEISFFGYNSSPNNNIMIISAAINDQNEKLFGLFNLNEFTYYTNSGKLLSNIVDNEQNILKNIYVNIKDCPEWMRPYLTKMRQDELAKPKYEEHNKQYVKKGDNNGGNTK